MVKENFMSSSPGNLNGIHLSPRESHLSDGGQVTAERGVDKVSVLVASTLNGNLVRIFFFSCLY